MKQKVTAINARLDTRKEIDRNIAYHQAGYATAIFLGNKQKQLPEVYFQIIVKPLGRNVGQSARSINKTGKYTVKVEGGRLIQNLPLSFAEVTQFFSWPQQEEYLCAFEADVINLLVGSLAEAKYAALSDDEVFNPNLVNLSALHFYGGSSDIEAINDYMECFMVHQIERERKLTELYFAAFNFVNESSNWLAISALAEFILESSKAIIHCEEVIALLESRLAA